MKRPSSRARLSRVLSTPKNTSPRGLLLVRIAWLTAAPASPDGSTSTFTPVCFVNCRMTLFETLNESCVMSVIVVPLEPVGADAVAATGPAAATAVARIETAIVSTRSRRMSGSSEVGLHGQQGAVLDRDGRDGFGELVAQPPGGSGQEVLAVERVPQARRPRAAGGSTGGEQRAQVARRARQTRRAVDDGDEVVIQTRLDVDVGERRRREQQHVGEEVVEPSAGAADDDHVRRAARSRRVQCELEVALVLLGGIPADLGATGDGGVDCGRIGRVEVSDDEVDVPTQRERVLDARVGGDGEDR